MTSKAPEKAQDPALAFVGASVGIDDRVPPHACQAMAEVRQGVDALDRALVHILVERQAYMSAAARIKPERGAVMDTWRVEDVVSKVKASADREGLWQGIAEPVWRLLIDRCTAFEFERFDERQAEPVSGS
jgi:isochorismate pyruvate lyase